MWKWIIVIAIIAGGYSFFFSEPRKLSNMDDDAGTMTTTKGNVKVVYNKKQLLEERYMLFGIGHSSGNDFMIDGFISGIPWGTAQSLLRQYPDLVKCNSQGSAAAKRAIQDISTVNNSSEVKSVLKDAKEQFDKMIRVGGQRICLKIRGHELAIKDVYHKDDRVSFKVDGKLIHVEKMVIESCQ